MDQNQKNKAAQDRYLEEFINKVLQENSKFIYKNAKESPVTRASLKFL